MADSEEFIAGWNYRVLERATDGDGSWLSIIEVYYDKAGNPVAYSDDHTPGGEDLDDLTGEMVLMAKALTKPVLTEDELPGRAESQRNGEDDQ